MRLGEDCSYLAGFHFSLLPIYCEYLHIPLFARQRTAGQIFSSLAVRQVRIRLHGNVVTDTHGDSFMFQANVITLMVGKHPLMDNCSSQLFYLAFTSY